MALKLLLGKTVTYYSIQKYQIHTREGEQAKMSVKPKIKVIKKGAIKNIETPPTIEKQTTQAAAREMVSTVTNWVSDFQQKRRDETKQALELLFQNTPQINGV